MPTACLNQPGLRVHLHSERLEVWGRPDDAPTGTPDKLLREIPLRDLDRVITSESVQFSGAALGELLRRGIPIQFFAWSGTFLGGFLPAQNHHGLARLRQYQRTLDPDFVLPLARRLITAKLYNQRRVLQRLAATRAGNTSPPLPLPASTERGEGRGEGNSQSKPSATRAPIPGTPDPRPQTPNLKPETPAPQPDLPATLRWLDSLFISVRDSRSLDELRGYEGASTARYFQAWATFLPAAFPFERRSTRPPLNPVNACISFGSTLLYNEAVAFLHAHGLDPALGLLHATEDGRWSLALDLIEPFRPAFVEALALDLFSHQILNATHFEPKNGGTYLNEAGRKKYFLQYERRLERQFLSEAVGHRTTLRQQLEQQAVLFKAALENPATFEPFLIN